MFIGSNRQSLPNIWSETPAASTTLQTWANPCPWSAYSSDFDHPFQTKAATCRSAAALVFRISSKREPIQKRRLAREQDGRDRAGVLSVLGDHVELGEHLGREVIGLVDDEHGAKLSAVHQVRHRRADGPGKPGAAVAAATQVDFFPLSTAAY